MRKLAAAAIGLALMFSSSIPLKSQENPYVHRFQAWGRQKDSSDKLTLLLGVMNGIFFADPRRSEAAVHCLDANVSYDQSIAMIDKYYKDHPERWNEPLGQEIFKSLTAATGPCPYVEPKGK